MVLCRLFTGYLEPILYNVHVYCKVGYLVIPVSLCLSPNMMSARLLWPSLDLWSWNTCSKEQEPVLCTVQLYSILQALASHRVHNVAVTLEQAGVLPPDVGGAEDEAAVVREDGGQRGPVPGGEAICPQTLVIHVKASLSANMSVNIM